MGVGFEGTNHFSTKWCLPYARYGIALRLKVEHGSTDRNIKFKNIKISTFGL